MKTPEVKENKIIYPCCKKCEIYLDYKDSYQCSDGDCPCHLPEPIEEKCSVCFKLNCKECHCEHGESSNRECECECHTPSSNSKVEESWEKDVLKCYAPMG